MVELDIRSKRGQEITAFLTERLKEQNKLFKRSGVDLIEVSPEKEDYLVDMVRFFRRRMMC